MGRSHGIHAEPITFGLKMLTFYQEFFRTEEDLELPLMKFLLVQFLVQ